MDSNRQFVAVAFKAGGRPYTYHNDGPPVAIGDLVRVPIRHGVQKAHVVGLEETPPPFETKAILGAEPLFAAEPTGENDHA